MRRKVDDLVDDYVPDGEKYGMLVRMVAEGLKDVGLCEGDLIAGCSVPYVLSLFCKINQNTFTVSDSELQPLGIGLWSLAATVNHSCSPNAVSSFSLRPSKPVDLVLRTISNVPKETEVNTSYIDIISTREKRDRKSVV